MYAVPAQRTQIIRLMRRQEYALDRCSLFHDQLAQQAGVTSPNGMLFDDWLNKLTTVEAYRLIQQLKDDH